jgi:hypothetical protein
MRLFVPETHLENEQTPQDEPRAVHRCCGGGRRFAPCGGYQGIKSGINKSEKRWGGIYPDLTVISLLAQVIASKKLGEVSEGRLDEVNSFGYAFSLPAMSLQQRMRRLQACQLIHQKAKEKFDQNMDKFRIYAMRNIFVPCSQSGSVYASPGMSSKTDEQLSTLRQQYLQLQAENRTLADSCRDTEVLLKDMRSALFTLRVGAQVFDDVELQNIAETVAYITHNKQQLEKMCAEATGKRVTLSPHPTRLPQHGVLCQLLGIIGSLTEFNAPAGGAEGNGEAMDAVQEIGTAAIETKDTEDISALAKSLRRK